MWIFFELVSLLCGFRRALGPISESVFLLCGFQNENHAKITQTKAPLPPKNRFLGGSISIQRSIDRIDRHGWSEGAEIGSSKAKHLKLFLESNGSCAQQQMAIKKLFPSGRRSSPESLPHTKTGGRFGGGEQNGSAELGGLHPQTVCCVFFWQEANWITERDPLVLEKKVG